ncbi:MAG: lytic transglycosylase domain-containing protein [Bryobacterales bacterium]
MRQRIGIRLVLMALALGASASAAEYAVLETGFRILAERHEQAGGQVKLFLENGGSIEFPAAQVIAFEPLDYVAPPAAIPPEAGEKPFDLETTVRAIAQQHQLPEALVHSVIAAESAYDPAAVSVKGAIGLMQLMPETARELAVDPLDPGENVQGGVSYLRQLLEKYAGSKDQLVLALAAYNAGPGAVDRYRGLPPYAETHAFVRRVIDRFLLLAETRSAE